MNNPVARDCADFTLIYRAAQPVSRISGHTGFMRSIVLPVCLALALGGLMSGQSPYVSVSGTVEKIDVKGGVMTVKPDKGDAATSVKFNEQTTFSIIPAGETDVKKGTPGTPADISAGDKVVARVLTADPTGKPARTVYVERQADLAKRKERTQEEWKSAVNGLVTSVSLAEIKITAKMAGSPAPKEVTLELGPKVDYERYDPANGKYEPSNLAAIKVGDQLRVLGEKNADSTGIKAENIGSGSFKTIGVQVKSIDAAGNQITGIETGSKKPVIIALRTDTSLKKFSDMAAMMVARQLNPTYQQAGGRGNRGGGGGGARAEMPQGGGAPPDGAPGGGRTGMGGGRGGRGGMDIGKIIEQQPSIQLGDLKPGDAIIVTGATANSSDKLIAIALVAGVEPILRAAPSNGADPLAGSWNMGGGGGGDQ